MWRSNFKNKINLILIGKNKLIERIGLCQNISTRYIHNLYSQHKYMNYIKSPQNNVTIKELNE